MDARLRALSDGTRRHILALIWQEARTAGDIASAFSMSRPAVSQHLRVLLESDLVLLRREGTRRFYQANHLAIAKLRAELSAFWDEGLSRLKRAAEQTGGETGTQPAKRKRRAR
jgi:DNA-binding transcriptional ArsR family regulator